MKQRVLLVEDDHTLRMLTADALLLMNLIVIECTSADMALQTLETLEPSEAVDLVLTDIRMPGTLDGFELAQMIWSKWPTLPVILTSGHRFVDSREMPGHCEFILKPWTLDRLYTAVALHLPPASI